VYRISDNTYERYSGRLLDEQQYGSRDGRFGHGCGDGIIGRHDNHNLFIERGLPDDDGGDSNFYAHGDSRHDVDL
jgi:hypothetical protein